MVYSHCSRLVFFERGATNISCGGMAGGMQGKMHPLKKPPIVFINNEEQRTVLHHVGAGAMCTLYN